MGYTTKKYATVYQITNLVNWKIYIGVTRFAPENRWVEHLWCAGNGKRAPLYYAIRKYGAHNFSLMAVASVIRQEDWSTVERMVIEDRRPEYNQTNGGEITKGRRLSPEAIERIRIGNIGKRRTAEQNAANSARVQRIHAERPEYRQKIATALAKARSNIDREKQREAARLSGLSTITRLHTPEMRAKTLAAALTPEAIEKSAAKRRGRKYPAEVRSKMGAPGKLVECTTLGVIFESAAAAGRYLDVHKSSVVQICKGKRNSAYGLKFRFAGGCEN